MNFEKNVMVKKYNDGVIEEVEDVILREFLLDININSKPIVKLLCIEKDLQELVTLSLIHISEPTRLIIRSRMPSSA